MARIRTIKPEFWLDEDIATLSESAMLLAIGLLNYADDEGYFNANELLIKAAIFPLRNPSKTIRRMIDELSGIEYIRLYSGQDGKKYGHIVNFLKHQRVDRGKPSEIKKLILFDEHSTNGHGSVDAGKEGKGREGKGDMSGKPDVPPLNFKEEAKTVLLFLNEKTGRNYQGVPANLDLIVARLKEGFSVTQLRQVVAKKTREWKGDDKMDEYLRPATLFNKTKFAQYSGELVEVKPDEQVLP